MKLKNLFFKKKGPYSIYKIIDILNSDKLSYKKNIQINDIKEINVAKNNEITFFHFPKYANIAQNTKASFCITNIKLKKFLPKNCTALIVSNVLLSTAKVTEMFYPNSINDNPI